MMGLLQNRFRNLSMRYKLLIAYSVPLELCFLCITLVAYVFIQNQYREQILYSAGQAYQQAFGAVETHFQNMSYILEQLEQKEDFLDRADPDRLVLDSSFQEQWKDYLFLLGCLMQIEGAREGYRLSIYVPDELFYADNQYRFFPMSSLETIKKERSFPLLTEGDNLFVCLARECTENGEDEIAVFRQLGGEEGTGVMARVNLPSSDLEHILQLTNLTGKGVSCLADSEGDILLSSAAGQEQYWDFIKTEDGRRYGWKEVKGTNGERVMVRKESLRWGGLFLYSFVPYADFYSQAKLVGSILIGSAVMMMVFILLISWILAGYYTRRLSVLNDNMAQIRDGNVNLEISEQSNDEIGKLYQDFNYMAKEMRALMLRQYRLGKDVKNAELKALQAQINPHFLYNTLDLINWSAMDYHATEIMEIAQNLAKFYRVSLNHGRQVVTIGEELEQIQSYINIENFHFDGAICYQENVPEEIKKFACINILLQPFVENSIMYSIAKIPGRDSCHISVRADQEDGDIIFRIEDDGTGMSQQQISDILSEEINAVKKGYGIRNVNFRIKLCYGENYGICYESAEGKGTCAKIRIPALSEDELDKILK